MLERVTQWISSAVEGGGTWALAVVMFIENVFPPIPSEAVLPFAGFQVELGTMSLIAALTASTVGSVAGALFLFGIGRLGGRPLVERYGRYIRYSTRDLDRAEAWFERYGGQVVFWCRMVPLARSVVSIPAGAAEMPLPRFTVLTTLGTLVWNALLIGAGYLLGSRWEQVTEIAGAYSTIVLALMAVAALIGGVWWWRRRRARARTPGSPARADVEATPPP